MKKVLIALTFTFFGLNLVTSAQINNEIKQKENITFPELLVFSDDFAEFFPCKNEIEKIVSDKFWLEGPVWVDALNGLLFSDIPEDKIYFWNEKNGLSEWLEPPGFANGLLLDENGNLLLMQGNYESANDL
jgi:gluconolactonase